MKNMKFISYSQQTYASMIVKLSLHLKWYYPIMPVIFFTSKRKFFFARLHPDSFSRGGECHRPWYWWDYLPGYNGGTR
jgi:hypothetical protein